MKTKIKNKSILIVAAFVLALIGAAVCATISDSANATNEQATKSQSNSSFKVSCNYEIDDPTIIPELYFYIGYAEVEYTWGQTVQYEGPANVYYENKGGEFDINFTGSSQDFIEFHLFTPIGYDIDVITPTDLPTVVDSDINYTIKYKKYSGTYQVDIKVQDIMGSANAPMPVEGYKLEFCDMTFNPRITGTTDSTGNYSFKNLTPDLAEGYIIGEKEGLLDCYIVISCHHYDSNHICKKEGRVASSDYANVDLSSKDTNHTNFEWWYTMYSLDGQTILEQALQIRKKSIMYYYTELPVFGDAHIESDGTIILNSTYMSFATVEHKFIPFLKDAATFDHWNIDLGDGVVKEYKPGDTFTMLESQTLNAEAIYTQVTPPGPGPDPDPDPPTPDPDPDPDTPGGGGQGTVTPTGSKLAYNTATGDEMLIILTAISLLFASAFAAHLYSKKRRN